MAVAPAPDAARNMGQPALVRPIFLTRARTGLPQQGAHPQPTAVDPRLDGALWDPQQLGHLTVAQPLDDAKDEGSPVVGGQPAHRAPDGVRLVLRQSVLLRAPLAGGQLAVQVLE